MCNIGSFGFVFQFVLFLGGPHPRLPKESKAPARNESGVPNALPYEDEGLGLCPCGPSPDQHVSFDEKFNIGNIVEIL